MNPPNQNLLTGSKPQSEGNEPGTLRLRQGKLENLKIKVKVIPHTNAVLPPSMSILQTFQIAPPLFIRK